MTFSWPLLLALLLLIPLAVAAYIWLQRRKRKFAVRFASLSLIKAALPRRSRWRRHLPFALLLISVASLVIAAARPHAVVAVPLSRTSIILALDVSLSMCSTDVEPNRLAVAQEVARGFVEERAGGTRIGLVAFGGFAELAVPPTTDKDELVAAIDGFRTSRGTAVGSAVLKAVDAIAELNPDVERSGLVLSDGTGTEGSSAGDEFEPDVVVLLTDGATTQGVDPIVAAEQAVDRGIRVYTIGFGTPDSVTAMVCTPDQVGSDVFGGSFGVQLDVRRGTPGGALRQFLAIDEDTLRTVANMTGGEYHRAEDADQLVEVFRDLPAQIEQQEEEREISVAFAAVGALFAAAAVGLSLTWNRFP